MPSSPNARRPVFSLSRVARPSRETVVKQEKKRPTKKRPRFKPPIPSFGKIEQLASILSSDEESIDDQQKRKKRRRQAIPIPKFEPTPESSDDDDAMLLGESVFTSAAAKKKSDYRLQEAVDEEFRQADLESTTVKEIVAAVQKRLGKSLNRNDRKSVKARLKHLMEQREEEKNQVSSSSVNCSNDTEFSNSTDSSHHQVKDGAKQRIEKKERRPTTEQPKLAIKTTESSCAQTSEVVVAATPVPEAVSKVRPSTETRETGEVSSNAASSEKENTGEPIDNLNSSVPPSVPPTDAQSSMTAGSLRTNQQYPAATSVNTANTSLLDTKTPEKPSVERVEKLLTEMQVLTSAVKHAFAVVAAHDHLDMKRVYSALTKEDANWALLSTKSKVKEHILQQIGAPQAKVLEQLEKSFAETDRHQATVKSVTTAVQKHFSNCPCGNRTTTESGASVANLLDLAQSDSAVEKSLIKRLQKMEKTCDQYENQTDVIRRTLKKHRRDMWKKRGGGDNGEVTARGKSRFLPDADEIDQKRKGFARRAPDHQVHAAQKAVFGVVPTVQPTLTQMFGGLNDNKEAGNNGAKLDTIAEGDEESSDSVSALETDLVAEEQESSEQSDSEVVDEIDVLIPTEPVPYTRIDCKHGTELNDSESVCGTGNRSLWTSMLTGNFESSWDGIFKDACDDDNESVMDDLIDIMDNDQCEAAAVSNSQSSSVEMSMLSQRGQAIATNIVEQVSTDPECLAALEKDCPKWQENVFYALHRRDSSSLSEAVERVRDSEAKLQRAKMAILAEIERKAMVLDVFERTMQQSIDRFQCDTVSAPYLSQDANVAAGFMPSQIPAPNTPKRRESLMLSEVKTLAPNECDFDLNSPMTIGTHDSIAVN